MNHPADADGGVRVRRTALRVDGHLCADCASRLVRFVRALIGVRGAILDLEECELFVAHEDRPGVEAAVRQAIASAGFRVLGPSPEATAPRPAVRVMASVADPVRQVH